MKKLPANLLTLALVGLFAITLPLRTEGPTAAELAVKLDTFEKTPPP